MLSNNLEKVGYKLGRGWQLDNNASKGEAILFQRITRDQHSTRWYIATNKKTTALLTPPPTLAGVGSIVDYKRQQLLYFREQGIACYDFAEKKERLLVPLDTNLFRARRFWLDSKEDILYYIRQEYSPTWKVLLSKREKQNAVRMKVSHVLLKYSFKTGVSQVITDFGANHSGGVADIRCGVFYAQSGQTISIVDIHSGRIVKELHEQNIVKITLAPRGKAIIWGLYSPLAYQINSGGSKTNSGFKGVFPSFSSDGKKLAFWDRTGAFYVAGKQGKPVCALVLPLTESTDVIRFSPALWCHCNEHIAIPLNISLPGNRRDVILCVLNIEEKTLTLCSHNVLDYGFAPSECDP